MAGGVLTHNYASGTAHLMMTYTDSAFQEAVVNMQAGTINSAEEIIIPGKRSASAAVTCIIYLDGVLATFKELYM